MKKCNVIALSLACVIFFAGQALAADWNFYGSARVSTFTAKTDNHSSPDTTNFTQVLHGNSRIGAKVKVSDALTGRFEYGASKGNANLRHLYGEWDFGPGKLLVGQTNSPLCWFYSKQAYNDKLMLSYGAVYSKRNPMLRLRFGDFKIAAISPKTDDLGVNNAVVETRMPKIEASWRFKQKKTFVDLGAGYGSYSILDPATGFENDVRSYILALGGGVNFSRCYLKGSVWMGQNTGPYGMSNTTNTDPALTPAKDNVIDNDAVGLLAVAGVKLNDTFTLEAGYGYTEAELDKDGSHEDGVAAYYLQTRVNLTRGFFFVPEIGYIDNKTNKNGTPQSEILYYGIKWQMNF